MLGASALESATTGKQAGPQRFLFPALDRRDGGDATWADTLDALRAPRRRDQKLWEWRRESPIRPVVFEDPGTMDDEVVQLHLEHRVVRRLLGRFSAQGFVHHDLSRACLTNTRDAIPRVVLLGRLALYGPGGARLHEEIVPVTARWIDPDDRQPALAPYRRDAEAKTLDLLESAFAAQHVHSIPPKVVERLRAAAPRDVRELLTHLESRAEETADTVQSELVQRGEREADAMRELLERQRRRVEETANRHRDPQLSLDFNVEERRQLEANRRHWDRRLQALGAELESEPQRIREAYDVRARRIEPVGLVYLWPITG
jgi:hypothetical protein